jgi:hypothetical protein
LTLAIALARTMPCGAQTPDAGAAASTAPCAVTVWVSTIAKHPDELVFTLWTWERATRTSGEIIVYAGGLRYSIAFSDTTVADRGDAGRLPTPIVVRFPANTAIESAYVGCVEATPCPPYAPYLGPQLTHDGAPGDVRRDAPNPKWAKAWPAYVKLVADASPLPAPAGDVVETLTCSTPYAPGRTVEAAPAISPAFEPRSTGIIDVWLATAPDGSVLQERVYRNSAALDGAYQSAALRAAGAARFAPQIYRCNPIGGEYKFRVIFP